MPTYLMLLDPCFPLDNFCPSTKQGNFIKHRSKASIKKNFNQFMAIKIVSNLACQKFA